MAKEFSDFKIWRGHHNELLNVWGSLLFFLKENKNLERTSILSETW